MTEQMDTELARCGAGQAARLLCISVTALHNWRRSGKIAARLSPSGRWLFDVRPHLQKAETA